MQTEKPKSVEPIEPSDCPCHQWDWNHWHELMKHHPDCDTHGRLHNGSLWYAPVNWVAESATGIVSLDWYKVDHVELFTEDAAEMAARRAQESAPLPQDEAEKAFDGRHPSADLACTHCKIQWNNTERSCEVSENGYHDWQPKDGTLLDYIHREAFPKVVDTRKQECGCVYDTMNTGDVRLTHCPRHEPREECPHCHAVTTLHYGHCDRCQIFIRPDALSLDNPDIILPDPASENHLRQGDEGKRPEQCPYQYATGNPRGLIYTCRLEKGHEERHENAHGSMFVAEQWKRRVSGYEYGPR